VLLAEIVQHPNADQLARERAIARLSIERAQQALRGRLGGKARLAQLFHPCLGSLQPLGRKRVFPEPLDQIAAEHVFQMLPGVFGGLEGRRHLRGHWAGEHKLRVILEEAPAIHRAS